MLRAALNALTALHSRVVQLKRLTGTPNQELWSPARITPSNYFRFLRGPEYTTIPGLEFIIPIDSIKGSFAHLLTFSEVPDEGTFKLQVGASSSGATYALNFDSTDTQIEAALREIYTGEGNVEVEGFYDEGFTIYYPHHSQAPEALSVIESTLKEDGEDVTTEIENTYRAWDGEKLKRGDRIVDGSKVLTIDELIVMYDLGAVPMSFRVRCE